MIFVRCIARAFDCIRKEHLVFLLMGLLASSRLYAQVTGGTISGAVTNASQLAMPNVSVTLKNSATNAARAVSTDPGGSYAASNLAPGNYEMTVEASGFSTHVRTNILLAAGANLIVNVAMQPGDASQVVVETLPVMAESQASTAPGENINASTVRDTPLNGRDWTQLASLEAGVTGIQTGGAQAPRGFGAAISVSGARPDQNS
jgi:hypothetical protein